MPPQFEGRLPQMLFVVMAADKAGFWVVTNASDFGSGTRCWRIALAQSLAAAVAGGLFALVSLPTTDPSPLRN
jgi:hypothetical protein